MQMVILTLNFFPFHFYEKLEKIHWEQCSWA